MKSYHKFIVGRDTEASTICDESTILFLAGGEILYGYAEDGVVTTLYTKYGVTVRDIGHILSRLASPRHLTKDIILYFRNHIPKGTILTGVAALVVHGVMRECDWISLALFGDVTPKRLIGSGIEQHTLGYFWRGTKINLVAPGELVDMEMVDGMRCETVESIMLRKVLIFEMENR